MQSLLIVLVIFAIITVLLYNFLVSRKNQVENIYASVDTQLKKRFDLIPSLVASVQEAMQHERGTLEELTSLRSQALKPDVDPNTMADLDAKISSLLDSLMIAVEDYPELRANENTMHLQRSLNEVEEQLAAARRAYNQAVTDYNNAIEMFPTNILASYMNYQRKRVFRVSAAERKNVDVKGLFDKK